MSSTQTIILATLLTFAYVLTRFISVMLHLDRATRRFAEGSLVYTVTAPLALLGAAQAIPREDFEVLAVGSVLWVIAALAFWAFAARRIQWRATP